MLAEVVAEYDFNQEVEASIEELLAIDTQHRAKGIIPLDEMAHIIDVANSNKITRLCNYKRLATYIEDKEFQAVDNLIDDNFINHLLAYNGYSPTMREIFSSNLFRAELLKAIKYPEISYRKFCADEYLGLNRKKNRVFIGLSLHKKTISDHTQLCKFEVSN